MPKESTNWRADWRNQINREFKANAGSWLRMVAGIVIGLLIIEAAPSWFPFFAFAYGLYFVRYLAGRIIFTLRIHQIGNEAVSMALTQNFGLWDDAVTQCLHEYMEMQSLDLNLSKVMTKLRGRDW